MSTGSAAAAQHQQQKPASPSIVTLNPQQREIYSQLLHMGMEMSDRDALELATKVSSVDDALSYYFIHKKMAQPSMPVMPSGTAVGSALGGERRRPPSFMNHRHGRTFQDLTLVEEDEEVSDEEDKAPKRRSLSKSAVEQRSRQTDSVDPRAQQRGQGPVQPPPPPSSAAAGYGEGAHGYAARGPERGRGPGGASRRPHGPAPPRPAGDDDLDRLLQMGYSTHDIMDAMNSGSCHDFESTVRYLERMNNPVVTGRGGRAPGADPRMGRPPGGRTPPPPPSSQQQQHQHQHQPLQYAQYPPAHYNAQTVQPPQRGPADRMAPQPPLVRKGGSAVASNAPTAASAAGAAPPPRRVNTVLLTKQMTSSALTSNIGKANQVDFSILEKFGTARLRKAFRLLNIPPIDTVQPATLRQALKRHLLSMGLSKLMSLAEQLGYVFTEDDVTEKECLEVILGIISSGM